MTRSKRKEQEGCIKGRGTTEQVFVPRNIIEQVNVWQATLSELTNLWEIMVSQNFFSQFFTLISTNCIIYKMFLVIKIQMWLLYSPPLHYVLSKGQADKISQDCSVKEFN